MMSIDTSQRQIAENALLGENVSIGSGTVICDGCKIGNNVHIGSNVYLDYDVIIRNNVTVSDDSTIGARCILGEYLADFYTDRKDHFHPFTIGRGALIRSETIIYGENVLGDYLQTGHRVTIRENSRIDSHVRIGTLCDIQGDCDIQEYVNIHSNVHIGQKSVVKKFAWIFPYVILTNDPNPPSEHLLGVTVEEYAIVSTGSVVLPGVTIGRGALVGAGAVVTRNVDPGMVALGNPARMKCDTSEIKDNITGKQVYPWQYSFDRGMPWAGIGFEKWEGQINDENNA